LTIVTYHNIKEGTSGEYTVTPEQFEEDLIAFKRAGYTTVFPSEALAYVEGKGSLPKKPLLLSFDDGHYNNMLYALPLLKKYRAKAVINIIGAFSAYSTDSGDDSNPEYSHLTWGQIWTLSRSGCFEIGNHTYNMHKYKPRFGIGKTPSETEAAYIDNISADIGRLQETLKEKCGVTPIVFAYPFGKYNDVSKNVLLSLGIKIILTTNEGPNTITAGKPECLYALKRYNRNGKNTTEEILSELRRVERK